MNRSDAASLFLSNARQGLNRWWRWVLGVIVILVIWGGVGSIPLVTACEYINNSGISQFTCTDFQIYGDSAVPGYLLTNYSFIIGIVGVWITVRLIHRKSLTQVITGRITFDYNRVLYAIGAGLLINVVLLVLDIMFIQSEMEFRAPNPWEYTTFFLFAIVFTCYQAGFEEVLFRGYLIQGMSLIAQNRIFLVTISSCLFALVHSLNPEPYEYGFAPYLTSLLLFGLFMSFLTLVDGGVELAVGYHAVNNLWVALIANTEVTALPSPSLFVVPGENLGLFPEVPVQAIALVALVAILNQKYKWFSWSSNK